MMETATTPKEILLSSALESIERLTLQRSKLLAERARLSEENAKWRDCVHFQRDALYTLLTRQTHGGTCRVSEADLRKGIMHLETALAKLGTRCDCNFNAGHEPTCALVKARERSAQ